jgi:hypothetical protein
MNLRTIAAACLALGLSACATEFSGVEIFGLCIPPAPTDSGVCAYPATCDAYFAGNAVLDATTAQLPFRLPVQLNNLLVDNTNTANGQLNTNTAYVQSFEMNYPGTTLAPWTVSQSVTVPTTGSASAVIALIPVAYFPQIVPPGSATASVVVKVRGHGVLASQQAFTTAWFQVPVEVCAGCLAGSVCAAGEVLFSCPSAGAGATSPGQSANFTCVAAP